MHVPGNSGVSTMPEIFTAQNRNGFAFKIEMENLVPRIEPTVFIKDVVAGQQPLVVERFNHTLPQQRDRVAKASGPRNRPRSAHQDWGTIQRHRGQLGQ